MNPYVQYMYSYPHKTAYRPLTGVSLRQYAPALTGGGHGLYLHIPFCEGKCGYCNLFSVTGQGGAAVDEYLKAVERQSSQYEEVLASYRTEFAELVIGGGTPLYLTEKQLSFMFRLLDAHFRFCHGRELVIETAPNQTTEGKLKLLKQAGVTRVSMGIQSFSDRELSVLGRRHSARKAAEALALLQSFALPCVNVDFIYGIPGQTVQSLLESLRTAVRFSPDEIFLYPLYVKHGAGLERVGVVPDGEEALFQYRSASSFLQEQGFCQDSMRRFVRRSGEREFSECGFGTSLALGCGGRSYLGKLHFCSPYATTVGECLERLREYETITDYTEITHGVLLSGEEEKRRYVIRHLFIRPGLPVKRYAAHFGSGALQDFPLLEEWMQSGYAELREAGCYLALTEKGLALSDYLGPQLISSQVWRAMEEWEEAHGRRDDFISGKSEKL